MSCSHEHKVNETRKRSLLKAITGRVIEILIGTLVFGTLFTLVGLPSPYLWGLGANLLEESICFIVSFFNERVWNKIPWGRKVEDIVDGNPVHSE